jgi:hypothetical protein
MSPPPKPTRCIFANDLGSGNGLTPGPLPDPSRRSLRKSPYFNSTVSDFAGPNWGIDLLSSAARLGNGTFGPKRRRRFLRRLTVPLAAPADESTVAGRFTVACFGHGQEAAILTCKRSIPRSNRRLQRHTDSCTGAGVSARCRRVGRRIVDVGDAESTSVQFSDGAERQ